MEIEIYDDSNLLSESEENLLIRLLDYASKKLNLKENTEVSVTILNNEEIKKINKEYRGKDYATDVISFAANESLEEDSFDNLNFEEVMDIPYELGDLFISIDKAEEQAEEYGHSKERELGFLAVHGFLHLNGYDHQTNQEEKEMFALQEDILREFGLMR